MREDLLGYLLSALEPHEMRQVEQKLRSQPALREELEFLQRQLDPLDRTSAELPVIETPCDLVSRTMAALPPIDFACSNRVELATAAGIAMAPVVEGRRTLRRTWSDLLVAALASAAMLGLVIPSIARGRHEARKIACQENLRQLGTAISQFVLHDQSQSLPSIAQQGPEAFAGMYAVRLAEQELLNQSDLKWCPDAPLQPSLATMDQVSEDLPQLVKIDDLRDATKRNDVNRLRALQHSAGGHYAYTLGVVDGDQYSAPHYEGRSTFAILGDVPITGTEFVDGVDAGKLRWGHGNSGANLLFEDGSVRYMDMSHSQLLSDHPFFNHRGSVEAGVNIDDASLAPSWRAPFISVRQR